MLIKKTAWLIDLHGCPHWDEADKGELARLLLDVLKHRLGDESEIHLDTLDRLYEGRNSSRSSVTVNSDLEIKVRLIALLLLSSLLSHASASGNPEWLSGFDRDVQAKIRIVRMVMYDRDRERTAGFRQWVSHVFDPDFDEKDPFTTIMMMDPDI